MATPDRSREQVEPNFKQPKTGGKRRRSADEFTGLTPREWRLAVLRRDRRCKLCGYQGQHLTAHHLIFKSHCEKQYRWDPRNGLALCDGFARGCHDGVHRHGKRIPLRVLPRDVVECLAEQGLRWEPVDGTLTPVGTLAKYFD